MAGTVIFAGRKGEYGDVFEIKHAKGLVSGYIHLDASIVTNEVANYDWGKDSFAWIKWSINWASFAFRNTKK